VRYEQGLYIPEDGIILTSLFQEIMPYLQFNLQDLKGSDGGVQQSVAGFVDFVHRQEF
jgi:hypothetical protein